MKLMVKWVNDLFEVKSSNDLCTLQNYSEIFQGLWKFLDKTFTPLTSEKLFFSITVGKI